MFLTTYKRLNRFNKNLSHLLSVEDKYVVTSCLLKIAYYFCSRSRDGAVW